MVHAMGAHGAEVGTAINALRLIVQALRLSARAAEKRFGISGAQLFVLQTLKEGGILSIGALAERTFTHQSSVSVLVSRLASQKLVVRNTDQLDRRRSQVALTGAGRALLRRAPAAAQTQLVEGLQRMPTSERRVLARTLMRLVKEMGVEHELPRPFFEEDGPGRRRRAR